MEKELKVAALRNGTVIDHIPADKLFQVVSILQLKYSGYPSTIGNNLESKHIGTKGIINLKTEKKTHVIAQEHSTCAVYGMPRSVVDAGLADQIIPIERIAQEIILNVGVK